jgi:hypothetical protein
VYARRELDGGAAAHPTLSRESGGPAQRPEYSKERRADDDNREEYFQKGEAGDGATHGATMHPNAVTPSSNTCGTERNCSSGQASP